MTMTRHVGVPAFVVFAAAAATAGNAFADGPTGVTFAFALVGAAGAVWAVSQGAQWEHELRQKSDEIAELNRTIASTVTGGDSWCYLAFSLPHGGGNSGITTVVHQGDYPLYDVSIRIADLDKYDLIKGNLSLETMQQVDTLLSLGNLSPGQARVVGGWESDGSVRYNIFIAARNGFVTQLLRLQCVHGQWRSATKVTRRVGGKEAVVLLEKVDPEFPRDSTGAVEW